MNVQVHARVELSDMILSARKRHIGMKAKILTVMISMMRI